MNKLIAVAPYQPIRSNQPKTMPTDPVHFGQLKPYLGIDLSAIEPVDFFSLDPDIHFPSMAKLVSKETLISYLQTSYFKDDSYTNVPEKLRMISVLLLYLESVVSRPKFVPTEDSCTLLVNALSDVRCFNDHYSTLYGVAMQLTVLSKEETDDRAPNVKILMALRTYFESIPGIILGELNKVYGGLQDPQATHSDIAIRYILDQSYGCYGGTRLKDDYVEMTPVFVAWVKSIAAPYLSLEAIARFACTQIADESPWEFVIPLKLDFDTLVLPGHRGKYGEIFTRQGDRHSQAISTAGMAEILEILTGPQATLDRPLSTEMRTTLNFLERISRGEVLTLSELADLPNWSEILDHSFGRVGGCEISRVLFSRIAFEEVPSIIFGILRDSQKSMESFLLLLFKRLDQAQAAAFIRYCFDALEPKHLIVFVKTLASDTENEHFARDLTINFLLRVDPAQRTQVFLEETEFGSLAVMLAMSHTHFFAELLQHSELGLEAKQVFISDISLAQVMVVSAPNAFVEICSKAPDRIHEILTSMMTSASGQLQCFLDWLSHEHPKVLISLWSTDNGIKCLADYPEVMEVFFPIQREHLYVGNIELFTALLKNNVGIATRLLTTPYTADEEFPLVSYMVRYQLIPLLTALKEYPNLTKTLCSNQAEYIDMKSVSKLLASESCDLVLEFIKLVSNDNQALQRTLWQHFSQNGMPDLKAFNTHISPRDVYDILLPTTVVLTKSQRVDLFGLTVRQDNEATLSLLLSREIDQKELQGDDAMRKLLDIAVQYGSMNAFDCLARRLPKLKSFVDKNLDYYLVSAARFNQTQFISKFIQIATHLRPRRFDLTLPIRKASEYYSEEAFLELIKHDASYKTNKEWASQLVVTALASSSKLVEVELAAAEAQGREPAILGFPIEYALLQGSQITLDSILDSCSGMPLSKGEINRYIGLFELMVKERPERLGKKAIVALVNFFWKKCHQVHGGHSLLETVKNNILDPLIQKGYRCNGHYINAKEAGKWIKGIYGSNSLFVPTYRERVRRLFLRTNRVAPVSEA